MTTTWWRPAALVAALLAAAGSTRVPEATAGGIELSWHTVDGGGRTFSTGGGWSLGATAGQHDAGSLAGGSYVLRGGFWRGGVTFTTSVSGPEGPAGDPPGIPAVVPAAFRYAGAVPNPFNPITLIAFELPDPRPVRLRVYSASGRLVRNLVEGPRAPGAHEVVWDGRDEAGAEVASGIYYISLDAGADRAGQKLVLLK